MNKKVIVTILIFCSVLFVACGNKVVVHNDPDDTTKKEKKITKEAKPTESEQPAPTEPEDPQPTENEQPTPTEPVETKSDPPTATSAPDSIFTPTYVAPTELSSDLYSYQLEVDGVVWQMPMPVSALESFGWIFQGTPNELLSAGYRTSVRYSKDELDIYVSITNFDINIRDLSDCYVTAVEIYQDDFDDADAPLVNFPCGIIFPSSTREEIETAYGVPTDVYEDDDYASITYLTDSYSNRIEFRFSGYTNGIDSFCIRCSECPSDFVYGPVSQEVPEIVNMYVAPESISDNLFAYEVRFDGELYQLPAPISKFIENGWKIVEDESDPYIAGHDSGLVTLTKNNQCFYDYVNNYTEYAVTPENCFVVSLEANDYRCNVPMEVALGIKVGMTQEELETALADVEYEKEEYSTFTSYEITEPDSYSNGFYFNVIDGIVTIVSAEHSPSFDDFAE